MNIVNGKYVPSVIIAGSKIEMAIGLLSEACDIYGSGCMRLHAKNRELDRIDAQLKEIGFELFYGCDDDEGCLLLRDKSKPHKPECNEERCVCEFFAKERY